jgi:hypothetical protein
MFVCLSVTVDQLLVLAMVDDALHGSDLLEWHCHFVTKTAAKKKKKSINFYLGHDSKN